MAEKAITSSAYESIILLLDMSKAFDTVSRSTLYRDLTSILDNDEMNIISILLKAF